MKKLASFLVNKRYIILAVLLVLAIAAAILMPRVTINEDMSKYLPADSNMKQGLQIMDDNFPVTETTNNIRVMFTNLTEEQKTEIKEKLEQIEYVDSVTYDSKTSNKENHTLYVLNMKYDYGSTQEKAIISSLDTEFGSYDMVYKNSDTASNGIPTWVLIVAFSILFAVLITMSGSWFEPVIYIGVIGIAVVLNMGSNIILGSVASITASIASIMQIILSMDYSIMLMSRYRQERKQTNDCKQAMVTALEKSFVSISSSAFTTIVGLLMLLFMSFTIGMNMGLVLAKGVFLSVVCVFTLLPCFTILCDKVIMKTEKVFFKPVKHNQPTTQTANENANTSSVPVKEKPSFGNAMSKFTFKGRFCILGIFVVLFVTMCVLQAFTPIAYVTPNTDPIIDYYPNETIVIIYENKDENAVNEIATNTAKHQKVDSMQSYASTLGIQCTPQEMSAIVGNMGGIQLDSSIVSAIYYDYFEGQIYSVQAENFYSFVYGVISSGNFDSVLDEQTKASANQLIKFANVTELTSPKTSADMATFFGIPEQQVAMLYGAYAQMTGQPVSEMTVPVFLNIAINAMTQQGQDITALSFAKALTEAAIADKEYSANEMATVLGMDENIVSILYLLQSSVAHGDNTKTISLYDFVSHLATEIVNDARFSGLLNEDIKASLSSAYSQLNDGKAQLKGDTYSRVILNTSLPADSEETTAFYDNLTTQLNEKVTGKYYLVGNTAMNYEMRQTFNQEVLLITILTAVAIFLVVALSFRNFMIPLILVLLVQCGVYLTITTLHFTGIYFLSLLILEAILMGATIDYGILFTNFYRDSRATMSKTEAVKQAYKGALHTILTSGLILFLVTAVLGIFANGSIAQMCSAIAIGTFTAVLLIVLVLPSLLMIFDKGVTHTISFKKKPRE